MLELINTKRSLSEELHDITEKAKNMTEAQVMFDQFSKNARELAGKGASTLGTRLFKKSFFRKMYERYKMSGMPIEVDEDTFCSNQYDAQQQFIQMLKDEGFTVDVKTKSGIILAGEMTRPGDEDIEADVAVSW